MNLFKKLILLLSPLIILAQEPIPFNLKSSTVTKEFELKQEKYSLLDVYIKSKGYIPVYGRTWEQKFSYPTFKDDSYKKVIKDFFIKRLGIKPSDISKDNYGHFFVGSEEYWLKLNIGSNYYKYTLLRVGKVPSILRLEKKNKHKFIKKYRYDKFPNAIAIPLVENFQISRAKYKKYDEYIFWIKRKKHIYKGEFWNIDFSKVKNSDTNSYRYMIVKDYKKKILALDGVILDEGKNDLIAKLQNKNGTFFIKLASYNSSFSIKMIKQEAFKQSLVLSPDKIKTELDKSGKITLDGIYFDFNKATLKTESAKAILSTVALMQKYPDLVLSVHGHTDSKGNDDYNMKLSAKRAESVKKALIAKGIAVSRLSSKGHGETEPITSNDTDDGRAKNRRVELHKVSGGDKKAIITIDFIKPLPFSVVHAKYSYKNEDLHIKYTKSYSKKRELKKCRGQLEVINYNIIKDSKVDTSVSRKEIIKNYENILELYNAKIVGKYSNTLYFKIKDRGDGVSVYGLIEGYTGSYTVKFLVVKKDEK